MKEIILIKNGELALKGLNRSNFEDAMIKQLRRRLKPLGEVEIKKAQSTVFVQPADEHFDFDEALRRVSMIFGIAAFSRAAVCDKDMDDIIAKGVPYLKDALAGVKTFKVDAKRADKRFPLDSPQICARFGEVLLEAYPHLKVDVKNPDIRVVVEVRDFAAYVRAGQLHGAGGMPVPTGGKAGILISGGIDSPVAAWMMAKRGIELFAVHFASPPYTGPRAEMKVKELLRKVAAYSGRIKLAVVPFTEIQEQISENCKEEYFTLIMRRYMMRIAEILARRHDCKALITGESVGQVASQTMAALGVTDAATDMLVLRPLIGMDKEEIIAISRKIDTFDISTLPYEDCCTVFTPKHPRTRPELDKVIEAEGALAADEMIKRAVDSTVFEWIE
ncbi:MAG: tRNA 4-thiouridine(8) synthase ThiI [Firmicutes bacterium]|nr:tRNA 4-thiouridine(8) synthase ThiI [Bacillota bacterium]